MNIATGEEETARHPCIGDDGSRLIVVEFCHFTASHTPLGIRRYSGARRLALSTGESIRYIDVMTFEVVSTGELLRRCSPS